MDRPQHEHIRDDLKGIVKGELLFDDLSRMLYSTDGSIFEVRPLGVVVPRDEEDVQALVRYAAEHQVPLIARGAGTGVAGEALGAGLVVDFSQHFRAILEVGSDTVRVQPGVPYRELARVLAVSGRRFAPDPANGECTLGGMLAINAAGGRAFRHGYTRDHVDSLRIVLDSGDVAVAGKLSRSPAAEQPHGRLEDVVSSVVTLLQQNADLIHTCRPRTRFNRCGYLLHDVLGVHLLDLARLLVGSEGTLALFTEATLRTIPLPGGRAVTLLSFSSLDAALRAALLAIESEPVACDLIDRRLISLVRGDVAVAALVPTAAEAVLLVEHEGDTVAEAHGRARDLADELSRGERLALRAQVASEDGEIERFLQVRASVLPSLYGLRGAAQPLAIVEDVGVPAEALAECLHRLQEVLQRHETTAAYFVHAATGQIQMRPFLDLQQPADVARLWPLADEVYRVVLDLGGTLSTQHGTGLARTPWVARQVGRLFPVLRDLKAIFDPRHLFNPGKIVGPAPGGPLWPLRRRVPVWENEGSGTWQGDRPREPERGGTSVRERGQVREPGTESNPPGRQPAITLAASAVPPLAPNEVVRLEELALRWRADEMAVESQSCNGCGLCRTEAPTQRMCPIFRATLAEAATPRAKANLIRHLLFLETDPRLLSSDEVRAVADLCVNCKMCARECPAHVNVPKLMLEVKAHNVAQHGMDWSDWAMSRTESFAGLGSAFALLTNALLANPAIRWVLEKLFGLSRRRRLPAFASRGFLRRAWRRGWTSRPRSARPRVAYFVDIFANYTDPLIAEALVAVLHHNGIEVYVPPGQIGCGMAPLAYGDVEVARETVQHNLLLLADMAREGCPILCTEPTAALMLRHDALDLIDDPDARLVAAQTVESTAFLWDLYQQGHLRTDFRRLELAVGHHVPCHLKALGRPPVGPALLGLIPGLSVHTIDVSCSGMAGTYGLKAENYATSLEAGRPMLEALAQPRVRFGSTECSTCRLQMEDAGGKRTLHPVQYLALAYGYLPELLERLHRPLGKGLLR